VIAASEIVVIGNGSPEYRDLGEALNGRLIIDLARAVSGRTTGAGYQGICW
jgi:GDP-mannose 6-dehydrogenase